MEFGPNHEKDSNDITPDAKLILEKVPPEAKLEIKGKILNMQEPVREVLNKKSKKSPKYEMRPRKYKFSIELNKPFIEELQELKNGSRVKTLIKTKVEIDREMDDHHQVQVMKKKIQSLLQRKKDLGM
jgi:hypothetical protein